jgi:hypothetical protein
MVDQHRLRMALQIAGATITCMEKVFAGGSEILLVPVETKNARQRV